MAARIDEGCWGEYDVRGSTEAHELTHTLGAVLGGAPHATNYGHCWDTYDVMCYDDGPGTELKVVCPRAHQQLLDCGHDDYFSTAPPAGSWLLTHWNVANSGFLADGSGNPPPVAPPPPPPPPPRPLPPAADTKRPNVRAEKAAVRRKKTARLRFSVSDDSGSAYVTASVFRKSTRLLQFGPRPLGNGRHSVRWTAPAKAQRFQFCVQAYDGAGNESGRSCAPLKVT
jgi:hypothetical protein